MNKNLLAQLRDQADDKGNINIDTGYVPRSLQAEIHNQLKRFNVLICHRRFGKTVMVINEMLDRGLKNSKLNPQYAYIAPSYKQAKSIAWEYLKYYTRNFPGVVVHEQELRIDIPRYDEKGNYKDRIRFMLLGAESPDSLRGIYLDGAILDEFAQCDPTIWGEVIRPALSDRLGWAIFVGTPKGQNHFFDLWIKANRLSDTTDYWFVKMLKASETNIIPKEELESARMEMSEAEYQQEYECSFEASLTGSYYNKYIKELEDNGQITKVPYQNHLPVKTFWDLGIGDSTAVWFVQFVNNEIHVIDFLQNSGVGLEWYVKKLRDKPYAYDDHWIPHDGAARELGSGQTRQEILMGMGLRTRIVPRQNVQDGIDAVRRMLPRCYFDKIKTEDGLLALRNYKKEYDKKKQRFNEKPLHDWASDAADAFRMLALVYNPDRVNSKDRDLPRIAISDLEW